MQRCIDEIRSISDFKNNFFDNSKYPNLAPNLHDVGADLAKFYQIYK